MQYEICIFYKCANNVVIYNYIEIYINFSREKISLLYLIITYDHLQCYFFQYTKYVMHIQLRLIIFSQFETSYKKLPTSFLRIIFARQIAVTVCLDF